MKLKILSVFLFLPPAFIDSALGESKPAAAPGKNFEIKERESPFHPLLIPKEKERRGKSAKKSEGLPETKSGSYSFRPLLIQGEKQLSDRSRDMRVEGESIAESEIFSPQIDFKGRIFEMLPEKGAEK